MAAKLKKGDTVIVLTGKDKGKQGEEKGKGTFAPSKDKGQPQQAPHLQAQQRAQHAQAQPQSATHAVHRPPRCDLQKEWGAADLR